jgi:uncharacterized protein with PQ loop repeat
MRGSLSLESELPCLRGAFDGSGILDDAKIGSGFSIASSGERTDLEDRHMFIPPASRPISTDVKPVPPVGALERILGGVSILTMLSTVPQILDVWTGPGASGVSLVSWVSYLVAACLWLIHGLQKRDKSIYLACVGWIVLDAGVVLGIVIHR